MLQVALTWRIELGRGPWACGAEGDGSFGLPQGSDQGNRAISPSHPSSSSKFNALSVGMTT